MKRFRWLWGGIALTVLLAGCGGDPAPEISPPNKVVDSPPEDPAPVELTPEEKARQEAQALEEKNMDAAEALVAEFYRRYSAIYNSDTGFGSQRRLDATSLRELAPPAPGTLESIYGDIEKDRQNEATSTGDWVPVWQDIVEYDAGDPGMSNETIRLEVCVDVSGITIHYPDGTSEPFRTDTSLGLEEFTVHHRGADSPWIITESISGGQPCE